jgi:hypothetical protein
MSRGTGVTRPCESAVVNRQGRKKPLFRGAAVDDNDIRDDSRPVRCDFSRPSLLVVGADDDGAGDVDSVPS